MPDDWEWQQPEDEEPPEGLRRKWEDEELKHQMEGKAFHPCPHCGKHIAEDSFSCIYCGGTIFSRSGPLGRFGKMIKDGRFIILVLIVIAAFVALSVF